MRPFFVGDMRELLLYFGDGHLLEEVDAGVDVLEHHLVDVDEVDLLAEVGE